MVVIRYEGPKGGPGMQEMLAVTGAIMGAGLGETTDCFPKSVKNIDSVVRFFLLIVKPRQMQR